MVVNIILRKTIYVENVTLFVDAYIESILCDLLRSICFILFLYNVKRHTGFIIPPLNDTPDLLFPSYLHGVFSNLSFSFLGSLYEMVWGVTYKS